MFKASNIKHYSSFQTIYKGGNQFEFHVFSAFQLLKFLYFCAMNFPSPNLFEEYEELFRRIGRVADKDGLEIYLIGGFVRDIYLQRESKDIDIVVVGKGIEFAKKVASDLKKVKLSYFENFGTAQILYQDLIIEFVGARKESYRKDSRKPLVEEGTLKDDQDRRDLTINAMGISLMVRSLLS